MDELKELQKRIQVLEDIEAIRNVKARYCRCNDRKEWKELADVFSEDAVLEQPQLASVIKGRAAIVKFLSETLSPVIVIHQVHHSEIEITSETTAKGLWGEYDNVIDPRSSGSSILSYGYYVEEYAKEKDGRWRIKYERLDRIYSQSNMIHKGGSEVRFMLGEKQ